MAKITEANKETKLSQILTKQFNELEGRFSQYFAQQ